MGDYLRDESNARAASKVPTHTRARRHITRTLHTTTIATCLHGQSIVSTHTLWTVLCASAVTVGVATVQRIDHLYQLVQQTHRMLGNGI